MENRIEILGQTTGFRYSYQQSRNDFFSTDLGIVSTYQGLFKHAALSLLQISVAIMILFLSSCMGNESKQEHESSMKIIKKIVIDDLGREIEIPEIPQRVISLAPSVTEILYFLDAENQVVARTQACDYPEEVNNLTVVSTYPLDIESIVKLNSDLVISVDGIVNPNQLKKLEELGVKVFFQKYETLEDINKSILLIGNILGKKKEAEQLVDSLKMELKKESYSTKLPKKTLMLTWTKPIYVYGKDTPFSDKIRLAGGENAMQEILNSPYPELTREYILEMNPDVILGYSFEQLDSTFFNLYPELKNITAYKSKQIFDVNDNLMSRPSPRYVESVIELREILMKCK